MNTIIELRFPENVDVVLTVVSTIKELKTVREQLRASPDWMNWPLSDFYKKVCQAIEAAESRWDSSVDEPITESANSVFSNRESDK